MRRHASDNVKYLNQSTIERLLNDDNCYSQSSGEYDEQALRDRLIELKQSKAEVLASKGYNQMLNHEIVQHEAPSDVMQLFAAKPRYVKPLAIKEPVKPTVKSTRIWKFLIKY
jgi:hypothetical protein